MTPPLLDWRHHRHWNGGRTKPCIYCCKPALLRDDNGKPAHKVCAERFTTPHPEDNNTTGDHS